MAENNIKRIAGAALSSFDLVMDWLGLGGGRNQGREYLPLNLKRGDHKPGSFTINRDSGAWADFAADDRGGDLVALTAWRFDCPQGEAAGKLAEFLGIPGIPAKSGLHKRATSDERQAGKGKVFPESRKAAPEKPEGDGGQVCVQPIPDDAPPMPKAHGKHGKSAATWEYRDQAGRLLFLVARWEPRREGERKQFAPLTLWRDSAGRLGWQWKAPPAPRALFNLPDLAARLAAPVLLVEGEKAADAARRLCPDWVVMTWPGGSMATDKADFSPLTGRDVLTWPDHDEAGQRAMAKAAARCRAVGTASVRRIALDRLGAVSPGMDGAGGPVLQAGGVLNPGDDAADLLARGWTAGHFALLVGQEGFFVASEAAPPPADAQGDEETPPARRHFRCDERGVWLVEVRDGEPAPARWLCAPLNVEAKVRDPENRGWGWLVAFNDGDRHPHREIVPARAFKGEGLEVVELLLDRGLDIAPKARPLILEYLQTFRTETRARTTEKTGWHETGDGGRVYVLPDRAFGHGGEAWLYEAENAARTFKQRGTLAGWREGVARLCQGNSRLVFAVSAAFAAPLLYPAGAESGGFHLRSNSSDGKTTAMRIAASVCGGPDYMQRWRQTDNGLEALAMQHCDALLLLDEIAQIDAKVAGECSYMLSNGSGKGRANKTGGARATYKWRLLFLSAGEIGLAQHMGEAGKQARAGQELRLAEIPADAGAGLGVFENLHEFGNGAEFAKAFDHATRKHHGTAFPAFLDRVVAALDTLPDTLHEAKKAFEGQVLSAEASGQARRVADRFALVAAAGELATSWGITGWPPGEAMRAALTCYRAWLGNRGGEGNQEERAMLAQVREFLERHGEARFADWDRPLSKDDHAPRVINKAGWRQHDPTADETEYYVYPEVFRSEVCKGHDAKAVAKLLAARGFLRMDGKHHAPKVTLPGEGSKRVFHLLPAIFGDES